MEINIYLIYIYIYKIYVYLILIMQKDGKISEREGRMCPRPELQHLTIGVS